MELRFGISVGLAAFFWGCSVHQSLPVPSPTISGHSHRAPHGGQLVEVGEEAAHLELLWDAAKGSLLVYVLDGECESSVRLRQEALVLQGDGWRVPLQAVANPLSDEQVGDCSQFTAIIPGLKGRPAWCGKITRLELKGQVFEQLPVAYPRGRDFP